jgi:hypothetical protein
LAILSYLYRFVSNFSFLAVVYLTLNFLSKYNERSIIAFLVLVYSSMRIVSTIRQFVFFQKIAPRERGEVGIVGRPHRKLNAKTGCARGCRFAPSR